MDLYIYDSNINLLGVIDSYSSLRWRRRYFEPGEIELHCQATAESISLLQPGNIIHRLDRQEAAIIEGISVAENNEGSEELTVTGQMGSSMLSQRIVTPKINYSGTVEGGMRQVVNDNAISARALSLLALGDASELTPTCSFQCRGKTLLAVCTALGRASGLGFHVQLNVPNRQWVFEVYQGIDRSVAQIERPYVLFSEEFQNITKPSYAYDTTGYANYAYVAGQGDGDARVIVEVNQTSGDPRRELWVDARDLQQDEGMTAEEYQAKLTQRGVEKLAEVAKAESFSADAVDAQNFRYLIDWDLGDIISFEKWGLRLDQRITEVEEVDEGSVLTVTPTCGNPLPEKLDLGDDV